MRALFLVAAMATPALADDPKFTYGKQEEVAKVKDVEWTASAEAGLLATTGNSETTTVTGGFHVTRKTGENKLSAEGVVAYAKTGLLVLVDKNGNGQIDDLSELQTQETVTAETFGSKLRYDRFLTNNNSLYIAALAARDVPAGKEYAVGGQVGYSRELWKEKASEAVAEVGYDYSREKPVTGDGVSIHSIRGFLGYKGVMTEGTTLEASGELLTNLNRETLSTGQDGGAFEDTRFNGRVAFSAKIGKNLAAQTSIEVHYDHRPAPLVVKNFMLAKGFVPPAQTLDTLMKVQIIYTFF